MPPRQLLRRIAARLLEPAMRNVEYFQRRLSVISMVAVVAFPAYYYLWNTRFPQPYENLSLRLFGSALFLPLIFSKCWPASYRRALPYYWYVALTYALPFFFTFMLLMNRSSEVWMISTLVAVFLMILLLDWVTLIVQTILGVGTALIVASWVGGVAIMGFNRFDYLAVIIFALVLGGLAKHDSERIRIEQERAMLATAGSIAHELRTPLLGIRAGATGLARYLPILLEVYRVARDAQLTVPHVRAPHLEALRGLTDRIDEEALHANAIIDMLLVNARTTHKVSPEAAPCSMVKCVQTTLDRYPFAEGERQRVSWTPSNDFTFKGVELLMVHVLFNLLKNALRHLDQGGHGRIDIWLVSSTGGNRLHFRDTGGGIPSYELPRIFTRFYTSANNSESVLGSGIGLAFCRDVIEGFGGTIRCESEYLSHTEFVLTFPT